jgi:hypothetical protein
MGGRGAGEWLQEKHGAKARRTWKKLHLADPGGNIANLGITVLIFQSTNRSIVSNIFFTVARSTYLIIYASLIGLILTLSAPFGIAQPLNSRTDYVYSDAEESKKEYQSDPGCSVHVRPFIRMGSG